MEALAAVVAMARATAQAQAQATATRIHWLRVRRVLGRVLETLDMVGVLHASQGPVLTREVLSAMG